MSNKKPKLLHPTDNAISASLRFVVELITWTSGPWLAFTIAPILAPAALIILIGLPSIFSTPGDKNVIVIATPGPIRFAIEMFLFAIAAIAPWMVWPNAIAAICSLLVVAAVIAGWRRFVWLITGH